MNVHYLQHVPFERLGHLEKWFKKNNHNITSTKFFDITYKLPSLNKIDSLIIMGGSMSVHEHEKFPWLKEEMLFINKAVQSKKKIIGICLGAQLIAEVLGSEVYQNLENEIGWFEVEINTSFQNYLPEIKLPHHLNVFHWHGETFNLPKGAINHISSEACQNQLFTLNDNIIGIQFHFEATESIVKAMVSNCSSELVVGKYIQNKDDILIKNRYYDQSHKLLESILNRFYY